MDPLVTVFPHKYVKANEESLGVVCTLSQALDTEYLTDAHLSSYYDPTLDPGDSCRRLSKAKLSSLPFLPVSQTLFYDWDLPGHTPGTLPNLLSSLKAQDEELHGQLRAYYTTTNGARFVFALSEPVDVTSFELIYKKYLHRLKKALPDGLDERTNDWTRLFRLPRVIREQDQTSNSPNFFLQQFDAADNVIPTPGSNPGLDAEWVIAARNRLTNRDCFHALFLSQEAMAEHGSRSDTLTKYVGQVVSLLEYNPINASGLKGTTQESIYQLFLPSINRFDGDQDWAAQLRSLIERFWVDYETGLESETGPISSIISGLRTWYMDLPDEPARAAEWASANSILVSPNGSRFYVIQRDGYYSEEVGKDMIRNRVARNGVEDLIALQAIGDKGAVKDILPNKLLDKHGLQLNSVEAVTGAEGNSFRIDSTGRTYLRMNLYGLNKALDPFFFKNADLWLRHITKSEEDYIKLCKWIGLSLAFDLGPICALSVAGPPGCGKKMLARGLAECITTQELATHKDLESFGHGLMKSPFLLINEGIPQRMHSDIADIFRTTVGGDPLTVNLKYRDPVTVRTAMRVLITGNNMRTLQQLITSPDLELDDRTAIAQRLLHINLCPKSSDWLYTQGGRLFTNQWIAPDGSGESAYVLARHFLWLHQKYTEELLYDGRFLMEGYLAEETRHSIFIKSEASMKVLEAIFAMLKHSDKTELKDCGLDFSEGKIIITVRGVNAFMRKIQPHGKITSTKRISTVLNTMGIKLSGRVVKYEIPTETVYREALEQGDSLTCKKIEELKAL